MMTKLGRLALGAVLAGGSLAVAQYPPAPLVPVPVERARDRDVRVQAPLVSVRVGRDAVRPVPVVAYQVPAAPAPQYLPAPPAPQGYVPAVPSPQPIFAPMPVRAMTHQEFARCFVPTPGLHEVWLIHPRTGQPVRVCFTLPYGAPRKVKVEKNELEFDYGRKEVEINFRHNGTVRVHYNH